MAPVTRSQTKQVKRPLQNILKTPEVPKKKIRLSTTKECPLVKKLVEDLGLPSDCLKSGKAEIQALDPKDPAFKNITQYINRSPVPTYCKHWNFTIFSVRTNVGGNLPKEHEVNPAKLRKMLFHGTKPKRVQKILKQGLKLPKHKSDPYFGPGIYFSDRFIYSFGYCGYNFKAGRMLSYVFVSDVLLGDVYKSYQLVPNAPNLKVEEGKEWKTVTVESVQGCAWRMPDPKGDQLIDGCVWPLGETINDPKAPSMRNIHIPDNEYVIYEAKRAIPKYLVKVEWESKY